jgi:hypothetical protein
MDVKKEVDALKSVLVVLVIGITLAWGWKIGMGLWDLIFN